MTTVSGTSAGTLFTIKLGTTPLTFTFTDANLEIFAFPQYHNAAIQYNNGRFNGFFFQTDFTFQNNQYCFSDQGGTWNIQQLVSGIPTGSNQVSGFTNIGDTSLTNVRPFIPSAVLCPPPCSSWVLDCLGLQGEKEV